MGTCVIYTRLSEDKTGARLGVERQERECRELAARLGLAVTRVYSDNDLSATSGARRPEWEAMLSDNPPAVVCWHTDRLMRRPRDLERLIERGTPVHAVTAGHVDLSTPAGRAVARTITAWAAYEGEQKALRQRAKNRQNADAGRPHWSVRPFGFTLAGELVEAEVAWVRRMYADILGGGTLREIARVLNAAGLRTTRGRPWDSSCVRVVLLAERNAGIRRYNGVRVGAAAAWPAIVPEETWEQAVALLRDPARRTLVAHKGRAPEHLLASIVVCGKCDGPTVGAWVARSRKKTSDRFRVYKCRYGYCSQMRCEDAERIVVDRLVGVWVSPAFGEALRAARPVDPQVEALTLELATLERAKETIMTMLGSGELDPAGFAVALAGNTARLEAVRGRLAALAQDAALRVPDRLAAALGGPEGPARGPAVSMILRGRSAEAQAALTGRILALPLEDQQRLIRSVFSRVAIMPRGRGNRHAPVEDFLITERAGS